MENLSSSDRLQKILSELKISKNALSKNLGYSNNVVLGHISSGRNGFSAEMAKRIVEAYPQFNYRWVFAGEGDMLVKEDKSVPNAASLARVETENGELRGQVKLLKELLKEKEKENVQLLQELSAMKMRSGEEVGEVGRKGKEKKRVLGEAGV
jgi:ABC-type multidrug transport system fused ATPase/permease subunit